MKANTITFTKTQTPVTVRCIKNWGFCSAGEVYEGTLTIFKEYRTWGRVNLQGLPRMTMHPDLFTDADGKPTVWSDRFELV